MRERVGIFGVVVFLGASLYASAGIALSADPSAISGWQGTLQLISVSDSTLRASLDYAVYLPGMYGGSAVGSANQYVYAYQLFAIGSVSLSTMTVGLMDTPAVVGAGNPQSDPTYGILGGIMPTASFPLLTANSFYTAFFTPQLTAGTHSVVLLFTSPNAPTTANASVIDSGKSAQAYGAPTPAPEPATLVLLGLGLAVIRRYRGV
jgi:hypothetical protein